MATKAENRLTTLKVVSYILVAIWLIIAAFPSFGLFGAALRYRVISFPRRIGQMRFTAFSPPAKQVDHSH